MDTAFNIGDVEKQLDTTNEQIGSINGHFRCIRLGNNSTFSISIPNGEMWVFYRSYQPNLLYINSSGAVTALVGQNQSIEVTASGNVITIKNTIGWAVNYFVFSAAY